MKPGDTVWLLKDRKILRQSRWVYIPAFTEATVRTIGNAMIHIHIQGVPVLIPADQITDDPTRVALHHLTL